MISKSGSGTLVTLVLALNLAPLPLTRHVAQAKSSYFTSKGCVVCHSTPTAATCAGCHQHSGKLTASVNKASSYAPGEMVTITMSASGGLSGWVGARLYDETGSEIARSNGTQSGTGSSTTLPAVLSAPAPASAGSYTWRIAYFGNQDGMASGEVHGDKNVRIPISVAPGSRR